MPAPVPVRVEHGSPTLLTSLASEAGSAQARRRSSEQAYRLQLQQMAQDSALVRDDLSRRLAPQRMMRQTSPTMLSDASGYAPRPQTFTNEQPQNDIQRLALQRQQQRGGLGLLGQRAQGVSPAQSARFGGVQMVPASGPMAQQPERAPATITERGTGQTFTRFGEGTTTITGAGAAPGEAQMLREMDPRFAQAQQQMVTPQVRQQMDMVRSMQGAIPPAQYDALLQAAGSGQMDMDKLIDDARQFLPSQSTSRQTAPEKQADKARANREVFQALRTLPEDEQFAYAQSQRWFEPEVPGILENDPAKMAEMQQRNREGAKRAIKSREVIAGQLADAYGGGMPMTGGAAGGQAQADTGYTIGQVHQGRRYIGGAAGDPNNWEVIK